MDKTDIKIVPRFWGRILYRSWSEVWEFFDVKGRIFNLIIVIILALVLWIGGRQTPVVSNVQEELVWLFWVAVLFMPILSIINSFFVAPVMYNELGGLIDNPFKITHREP